MPCWTVAVGGVVATENGPAFHVHSFFVTGADVDANKASQDARDAYIAHYGDALALIDMPYEVSPDVLRQALADAAEPAASALAVSSLVA